MAQLEKGTFCPLIQKKCVGLKCSWYIHVRGNNPQSGTEVDEYACAIAWTPILLINTAHEVRKGAAETESLRKTVEKTSDTALKTNIAIAGLMQGKPLQAALPAAPNLPALETKEQG